MPARLTAVLLASLALIAVMPAAASAASGDYVVVYDASVARPGAETARQERARGFRARFEYAHAVKGFSARLSQAQVDALRADPDVAAVVPNRPVHATAALAAGEPLPPTGVRRIHAATADTVGGAGSAVAVIDTGIDLDHPDLNAVDAVNCIDPAEAAEDDDGHGTHVAGTIGARNDGAGVVGVAPGTQLFAVKVLDENGDGTIESVVCGLDWVAENAADEGIAVANMSLGGGSSRRPSCPDATDPMHAAVCGVVDAGVLPVVAAGNETRDFGGKFSGPASSQYPAEAPAVYPEVLTVSAISDRDGAQGGAGGFWVCSDGWSDTDDTTAPFSNWATRAGDSAHTIAGPGLCITSAAPGGGTSVKSGTSMATPHVAGVVARCVSEDAVAGPCAGLTPAELVTRMRADASAALTADPAYGFTFPSGRIYGPLVEMGEAPDEEPPPPDPEPDPGGSSPDPPPADPAPPPAETTTAGNTQQPIVVDTTAPSATLSASSRRLRAFRRLGLPLLVRCGEDCRVDAKLVVGAAAARRLGLAPGKPLARAGSDALGTELRLLLRPGRRARRALRPLDLLRVKVVVTVTDAAGNRSRVTRRVTLRR